MQTPYSSNVLRSTFNIMGIPHITQNMKWPDPMQSKVFDRIEEARDMVHNI